MESIKRIRARLRTIMLLMMATNREISANGVDQLTTLLSFAICLALLCVSFGRFIGILMQTAATACYLC